MFWLFIGLWVFGGLVVAYGATPTEDEESAQKLEQKTPEPELVPTIREGLYWKEVIMKIRCPYCDFLYDETLDKCPQCGGRI